MFKSWSRVSGSYFFQILSWSRVRSRISSRSGVGVGSQSRIFPSFGVIVGAEQVQDSMSVSGVGVMLLPGFESDSDFVSDRYLVINQVSFF